MMRQIVSIIISSHIFAPMPAPVLMDRTLLATSLLEAARNRYAARVSFTFDAPLTRWGGAVAARTGGVVGYA